jgi:nucleoside-diphosphate-sugar epimerase
MRGADVIVNAASYTGSDASKAALVNHEGTRNLLGVAATCKVPAFVQLSTTSVYGTGPHRGETETSLPCRPESAVSRARTAAEQIVLEAGGTVVRAGLIYGPGDRWFIPSLIRMATILGGPVGNGDSKLSVINVVHLGRLVAGLLTPGARTSGTFHAAEPTPVTVGQILRHIEDRITGPRWSARTDTASSLALLLKSGFTGHQVALLSQDHWYQSDRLWTLTGTPPPRFGFSAEAVEWYRQSVGT